MTVRARAAQSSPAARGRAIDRHELERKGKWEYVRNYPIRLRARQ
jgi:hypothetical protein